MVGLHIGRGLIRGLTWVFMDKGDMWRSAVHLTFQHRDIVQTSILPTLAAGFTGLSPVHFSAKKDLAILSCLRNTLAMLSLESNSDSGKDTPSTHRYAVYFHPVLHVISA